MIGISPTNCQACLERKEAIKGAKAIKILKGAPTVFFDYHTESDLSPATLNQYHFVDSFENYSTSNELTTSWNCTGNGINMTFDGYKDFTDFNAISMFCKGKGDNSITVHFLDMETNSSATCSFDTFDREWGRQEATISWGNCDYKCVEKIYINVYGRQFTELWLDNIELFDIKSTDENSKWIEIIPISTELSKDGFSKDNGIAAYRGNAIIPQKPLSIDGNMEIKLFPDKQESQHRFVEKRRRDYEPLFYRMKDDGWNIHINKIKTVHSERKTRMAKDISIEFTEDSKE